MRNRFETQKKRKSLQGMPMDAALRFLGARARTVREVERHLDDLNCAEADVMDVVNRLTELGLLNDLAYAEEFVRTRLATKPVSKRRLREQLMQHETDPAAIDAALSSLAEDDESAHALEIAQKYARQMASLEPEERAQRILQRLITRGYGYDDAKAAVEQCMTDVACAEEEP